MIDIFNIKVFNFEGAVRGARNPMESHSKSDSFFGIVSEENFPDKVEEVANSFLEKTDWNFSNCKSYAAKADEVFSWLEINGILGASKDSPCFEVAFLGYNDINLLKRLVVAGSDHRKFLRQIFVTMDIEMPLYWWKEADQYRINCTTNSESTMHTIMSKPFDITMFQIDSLRGFKRIVNQKPNEIDEDLEEWMDWPLNDLYQVSNQGRVKRKDFIAQNNRVWKERILTNTETADHYLKVGVKINGQQKDRRVHQLVAQTWLKNPNNYNEINHKNGNKLDNRVENLEWTTSQLNQQHAVKNNLQPRQVQTYKGKLTKEQRDEIISRYNTTDISQRQLAKEYNVSHTTIGGVIHNRYNYGEGYVNEFEELLELVNRLNELRDEWLKTKDREVWRSVIQMLPSSWLQKRTWTANYEVLRNIYFARKNHKLQEWRDFCRKIETLPYAEELITYTGENK